MVKKKIVVFSESPHEHWAILAGFEAFFQVEPTKIYNDRMDQIIAQVFMVKKDDLLLDIDCRISLDIGIAAKLFDVDLIIYIGGVQGNPKTTHIGDIVFVDYVRACRQLENDHMKPWYCLPDRMRTPLHQTLVNKFNFEDYYPKAVGPLNVICQKTKIDPIAVNLPKKIEAENVYTGYFFTDEEVNQVYENGGDYVDSDSMRDFMHACEVKERSLAKNDYIAICSVTHLSRKQPTKPVLMNGALMASIVAGYFMLEFFKCKYHH